MNPNQALWEKGDFTRIAATMRESEAKFVAAFRPYYGPTMNAFDAAEKNGRARELLKEIEALFSSRTRARDRMSLPFRPRFCA